MKSDEVLVELRFDKDAEDAYEHSAKCLAGLDVQKGERARDPSIVAALTVAAAAIQLVTEFVKLRHELKAKGKKRGIHIVKLNKKNQERSLSLLESTESEIATFVSGD
jgi:hypothetical protein